MISRTSVMQYRGTRNMRQIGDALGVSHVLEGSVRKTRCPASHKRPVDRHAHRHARLGGAIRSRSERRVRYPERDRAKSRRAASRQNLSLLRRLAIERPPTADTHRLRSLQPRQKSSFWLTSFTPVARETNLLEAVDLLNQAVSRDPSFFKAYCLLASTHDLLYFLGHDHTPARLALAEAAIEMAFRLHPDAGEAHLARAENLYRGYLDYNAALAELEVAAKTLPNNDSVFS